MKAHYRLALVAALISVMPAKAQTPAPAMVAPAIAMRAADPLDRAPQVLDIQLFGPGVREAVPDNWPATLVFRNPTGGGCTATIVGARVILTAAHCMPNNATSTVQTRSGVVSLICTHHPRYPADISADFALCFTGEALDRPPNGFEVLNSEPSLPAIGSAVRLLGFGCRTPGGSDESFGKLFEGDATVSHRDQGTYIVTRGGAALCFGDSGGGAYLTFGQGGVQRRLFAINSRGDINTYSWLSTTAGPLFRGWAEQWVSNAAHTGAAICGLTAGAPDCRQ